MGMPQGMPPQGGGAPNVGSMTMEQLIQVIVAVVQKVTGAGGGPPSGGAPAGGGPSFGGGQPQPQGPQFGG